MQPVVQQRGCIFEPQGVVPLLLLLQNQHDAALQTLYVAPPLVQPSLGPLMVHTVTQLHPGQIGHMSHCSK